MEKLKTLQDMSYDEFMSYYKTQHARCPKCGYTGHVTTIAAYALVMDDKASYKDKNRAWCSKCTDEHIVDERTPEPPK